MGYSIAMLAVGHPTGDCLPGKAQNPWYFIMGIVGLFFAPRGLAVYEKLPEKLAIAEVAGKKLLLMWAANADRPSRWGGASARPAPW